MSQTHIRKAAGWGPLHRAWARLHHPRTISAVYGVWWTLALTLGGYSMFQPPRTIEAVAGDVLMSLMAAAIAVGGLIGVIAVPRGAYWAERPAIVFVTLGLGGYAVMVGLLWIFGTGNRGMQELGIIGAILFTLIRLHWVAKQPYSHVRATR